MEKYVTVEEFQEMFVQLLQMKIDEKLVEMEFDGVTLPPGMTEIMDVIKEYDVREDDVWLVTYPKAGTTWVQEILSAVMHDGILEEVNKKHTVFRVPFIEMSFPESIRKPKNLPPTYKIIEEMPSPRVIKTHLPGKFLPSQLWQKKPKVIYVIRNPKDLTVSYFHFMKIVSPVQKTQTQPFEDFVEEMLTGKVYFGPWWDHYLYFWKMRHEPNILLLRFEDLKKDLRGNVEKISRFVGKDLSADKLDAITEHCSFANMKKNPMANQDTLLFQKTDTTKTGEGSFMRKGKVGDWKNYFTVAQNEAMDAQIRDKLLGTGLTFDE